MISCAQYDYIEIACTYKYDIKLVFNSGSIIIGKALDTQYNDNREECIKLLVEGDEIIVALESVIKMKAIEQNPYFVTVDFD